MRTLLVLFGLVSACGDGGDASRSLVIGNADRTIQSYACGDSTVVAERSASGWTTIANPLTVPSWCRRACSS